MRHDTGHQSGGTEIRARSGAANTSRLARLATLDGYGIAQSDPDIRGWAVRTADGWKLGEVEELIVDTTAMRVRYMVVRIDKDLLMADSDRRVFVPLGTARLDDEDDSVIVERLPIDGFAGLLSSRDNVTSDDEVAVRRAYGGSEPLAPDGDLYGQPLYDDRRFWANRRQGGEDVPYIQRSPKGAERR